MKLTARDILNKKTNDFILVEPFVDFSITIPNGFIQKVLLSAELANFVSAKPKTVYPIAVTEFFGNLDRETNSTVISTRRMVNNRLEEDRAAVNLHEAADLLGLRSSGESVESACSNDLTAELRRYSSRPTEVYVRGKNFSNCLKSHFKTLMDVSTRVILSHYGNHSTITPVKLQVMAALCNEVHGVKYNWAAFIIKQWTATAREVEATRSPTTFNMGQKLRFGTRISFVLKQMQPYLDDRFSSDAKKIPQISLSQDIPASLVASRPLLNNLLERSVEKSKREEGKKKKKVDEKKGANAEAVCSDDDDDDEEEESPDKVVVAYGGAATAAAESRKEKLMEEKQGRAERARRRSSSVLINLSTPIPKRPKREQRSVTRNAQSQSVALPVNDDIQEEAISAPNSASNPTKDEGPSSSKRNLTAPATAPEDATLPSFVSFEEQVTAEVLSHFKGISLPESMVEQLSALLLYTRLHGERCSIIASVAKRVGKKTMEKHEAETLTAFNTFSFSDFINYSRVWDRMEEYVVAHIPEALNILPKRENSLADVHSCLQDIKAQQAKLQEESEQFRAIAREAEEEHCTLKAELKRKDDEISTLRKQLLEKESRASSSKSQNLSMQVSQMLSELQKNRDELQTGLASIHQRTEAAGADTAKGEEESSKMTEDDGIMREEESTKP